jgi:hypothetical protein
MLLAMAMRWTWNMLTQAILYRNPKDCLSIIVFFVGEKMV